MMEALGEQSRKVQDMHVIVPSEADRLGGGKGHTEKQFEVITIQLAYEPSVRARFEWLVRQLEGKTQILTQATFFPPRTLRQGPIKGLLGHRRVKADFLTRLDARVASTSTDPYVGVASWLSNLDAPRLTWLAATNSPDVWKFVSRCKLLETLEVEIAHHEDDARRLSWNIISTALHGHTNLHSLSIHCQAGRGSLSPMVLQSLRYLTLKGDPSACKQFLARVSLPTLKMIRLATAYRSNSDQDIRALLEAISNFAPDALYANDRSFRCFRYPSGQRAVDVHIEPFTGVYLRLRSLDSFPEGWVSGIRYIEIASWQSGKTLLPSSSLPLDASISSDSPTPCAGCTPLELPSGFSAYFRYFKRLERLTIKNENRHCVVISRHSSEYTITHVDPKVLECFVQQATLETCRPTSIGSLPVELLGMIYKCRFVDAGFKAVIPMMSVCQYWRAAADTVPCLWLARYPDPKLPTVALRLMPVNMWPVTVRLSRRNTMDHVTSLDVCLSDLDQADLKKYEIDIVIPNLLRLDTTFPNPRIGRPQGSAFTISIIKAHHLRSLTTYSSRALWDTLLPEIATLEELSVLYEPNGASWVYLDEIIMTLLALPELHSFSLSCRCIFMAPEVAPEVAIYDRSKWDSLRKGIILPKLQNLTLAGCHIPYLMNVYKFLTSRRGLHPPKVMFRLHDSHMNLSSPDSMDTEYVKELSKILQDNSIQANHLVVHPCPPVTPGYPARRYGPGSSSLLRPVLRLQGYNVSESPRHSDLIFDLSINVYELDSMKRRSIINYVHDLIVGLRLTNIQSLDIHGGFSPSWSDELSDHPVTELRKVLVDALFAAMPGVAQLKFEQCHIEDIKRVFLPPDHESRPKRLERLERLTIKRMRLSFPDRGNPIVGILQKFACLKRFDLEADQQGGVGPMIPKIIREFVDEVYMDGVEVEVEERRHLLNCYGYGKTPKPPCDCSAYWEVV